MANSKVPPGEADDPALFRMKIPFVKEEHAQAGINQERPQQIHHPGKMFDQLRTQRDHRSAHDQRPDHPPFQKAALQILIHPKRAKNHQEKKQVLDTEGFFDQIRGKKFQGQLLPIKIEHSKSKKDGDCDPPETAKRRLTNFDLARAAMADAEVHRDRYGDEKIERNPVAWSPYEPPR